MAASRSLPAIILLVFAGCAAPLSEAEVDRLARASIESQKTGICNIHHIRMQRKLVPVEFGHLPLEYYSSAYHDARLREFPNAREYALEIGLGSQHTNRKVWRYVCPECKRAEREYTRTHPHDEFAKTLGPE